MIHLKGMKSLASIVGGVAGAFMLLAALWSSAYSLLGLTKLLGAFPSAFAQYPELFTTKATVFAVSVLIVTALAIGILSFAPRTRSRHEKRNT